MKKYIFLGFFLLISWDIAAQTELQGKITDTQGEVLPFASVAIAGTSKGTSSNADGFYALRLSAGEYVLECRYIGYKPKQMRVTITTLPTPK